MYIPRRFAKKIALHLARNLQHDPPRGTPLYLGVHGPAGEGKTSQTEKILQDAKVHTILVSGGELESGTAGEPAKIVRTAYLQAGDYVRNGSPAALLLNDADAAIGSWGEMTQYTVNTQNLVTELMHLADYPTKVENQKTPRIPVYLTGNDFTRLYSPLRRPGRMDLFLYQASRQELHSIVLEMFPYLRRAEISTLIAEFPSGSVAFWGAVAERVENLGLLSAVQEYDLSSLAIHLIRGGRVEAGGEVRTASSVRTAAQEVIDNGAEDFLSEQES